jgi:ABC-type branched-subunit amino acid transport system substrate-binding protein
LKRPEIDRRLAAGEPAAQVARDYDINLSSLHRHRVNCLKLGSANAIKKEAARGSAAMALLPSKETLSGAFCDLHTRIDEIIAQAQAEGSLKIALSGDPPDRYVFNYRASYAEETAAVVGYLVKVKRLLPEQIAVFAQQDAYGDAGFIGVEKAIRSLRTGNESPIVRIGYQRNTVDVDDAVAQLQQIQQQKARLPIKAVIMVPTYRAAAKFIEKTRDLYPDMIYTSVSFVGSTALANELMLLGKKYATGVIVTQVVPALEGHSSLVLDYKSALAKYFPGEAPDYVSLEGYVDATVLIAALQQNGAQLDSEKLVTSFENLRDLDIGLGAPIAFSRSEHQGVHKVWGTQLDADGRYQPFDLQ